MRQPPHPNNHPFWLWPEIWLMTDERNDDVLEQSVAALPVGSGIIFRHYHLGDTARRRRFDAVKAIAKRRHHLLLLAGSPKQARIWGADGVHGRDWTRRQTRGLLHSAPVHNTCEITTARQGGADIFFLSPIFPTRSHPGAPTLHKIQVKQLIALCQSPVILLGGMNASRFNHIRHLGAHGWAAIDALTI